MKPDYTNYNDVAQLAVEPSKLTFKDKFPLKETAKANNKQIGGEHYKKHKGYEPWDVVNAWGLGYLDGTALKYIARWRDKNGIQDLQKAIHFLEKLIEQEQHVNTKSDINRAAAPRREMGHPEPCQGTLGPHSR